MHQPLFHHTGRALLVLGLATLTFSGVGAAGAAASGPVDMGTAKTYAVLGGQSVTNTGASVLNGDLGVHPGNTITGFGGAPNGTVNGSVHTADPESASAQAATTAAYDDAAGRNTTVTVSTDLGNQRLVAGVYTAAAAKPSLSLTGTVTLDGEGKADSVWVFQAGSSLITAPGSRVALINGANACNVYWKVESSATLDTSTDFVGTILALTSITANTKATVQGRLLARNGSVTLDANVINAPVCAAGNNSTTSTSTTSTAPADTSTAGAAGAPDPTASTTTTPAPTTPAGGDTSRAARRPSGGTATTNTRSGNPPLADTGSGGITATAGLLLVLMGLGLSWFGRPDLAHSTSTGIVRRMPAGQRD